MITKTEGRDNQPDRSGQSNQASRQQAQDKGKGKGRNRDGEPEQPQDGWKEVRNQRNAKPPNNKPTEKPKDPETETTTCELIQDDWSHPVLTRVKVGAPGIILAQTTDHAAQLAKQLQYVRVPTAVITVSALDQAEHCERVGCRLLKSSGQSRKEVFVNAYLCNFGKVHVQQLDKHTHSVKTELATTTVIALQAQASWISDQAWTRVAKLQHPKHVKEALQEMKVQLEVVDCFRLERTNTSFRCLLRVRQADLKKWLKLTHLPVMIAPAAPTEGYRVLWSTDATTLQDIIESYGSLFGFAGVATKKTGELGARFDEVSYHAARQSCGLVSGNLYHCAGVPVEMSGDQLLDILQETGWNPSLIPFSRRSFGSSCTYRVRALTEPPKNVFRICHNSMVSHVHVSPVVRAQTATAAKPEVIPQTWGQASRLVSHKVDAAPTEPAISLSTPPRQKRAKWGDSDMSDSDQNSSDLDEYEGEWGRWDDLPVPVPDNPPQCGDEEFEPDLSCAMHRQETELMDTDMQPEAGVRRHRDEVTNPSDGNSGDTKPKRRRVVQRSTLRQKVARQGTSNRIDKLESQLQGLTSTLAG
eukprot:6014947-Amphidinium_carterae.2